MELQALSFELKFVFGETQNGRFPAPSGVQGGAESAQEAQSYGSDREEQSDLDGKAADTDQSETKEL